MFDEAEFLLLGLGEDTEATLASLLCCLLSWLCAWLLFLLGALWHADESVESKGGSSVEDDECPHDAEVSPSVAVVRVDTSKEGICRADGAEAAFVGGIGVLEVTTHTSHEWVHVLRACLTIGWLEVEVFVVCAGDFRVGDSNRQERVHQVGEW